MFDAFEATFSVDCGESVGHVSEFAIPSITGLPELLQSFGGSSFAGGLYRVIHPKHLRTWTLRIGQAFPAFEKRITCFGYDWLGRAFALDSNRLEDGEPGVVMFEPGTGEALEIPSNILTFHNVEIREFGEAALAISFFKEWLRLGGAHPSIEQCIGYRLPLFLSGADNFQNLELSDLGIYWHIMSQLISKTRGLPVGTPVRVSAQSETDDLEE